MYACAGLPWHHFEDKIITIQMEFIWTGIEIKSYKDDIIVIEIENNK